MKNIRFLVLAGVVIFFSQPVNSNVRTNEFTFSSGQQFMKSMDNVCYVLIGSVTSRDSKGRSVKNSEAASELKNDVLSAIRPELAKIGIEILPCTAERTAKSDTARLSLQLTVRENKNEEFKFRYDLNFRLSEAVKNRKTNGLSRLPLFIANYFSHEDTQQEALTALVNKAAEYAQWSSEQIKEAKAN